MSQAIYQPQPRPTNLGKTTLTVKNILTPGQSVCLPHAGDMFYLGNVSGSAGLGVKPNYGVENIYQGGTGLAVKFAEGFQQLFVRNPSATQNTYYELTIGFDGYIDNRILLSQSNFTSIIEKVYDSSQVPLANVPIPDHSGTLISDPNGTQWFALNREYILISNAWSDAQTILMNTAYNTNLALVMARTVQQFPLGGDLGAGFVNVDGGTRTYIGGIISCVYSCVPKP